MEVLTAIESRRTIHKFNTKKVNEGTLIEAIKAANQAPCHKLTFPWRFTNIIYRTRHEILSHIIKDNKNTNSIKDKKEIERLTKKILDPSHLLIASQIKAKDEKTRKEDYAACACAVQNLSLYLASKGVGTKWSTGVMTSDKYIYKLLGIDESKEEIIGFIWIGYGNKPNRIERPQLKDVYREK